MNSLCSLSLSTLQIAAMLLLHRAASARPLFRTSSTIGSFFIVVTSKFLGFASSALRPWNGLLGSDFDLLRILMNLPTAWTFNDLKPQSPAMQFSRLGVGKQIILVLLGEAFASRMDFIDDGIVPWLGGFHGRTSLVFHAFCYFYPSGAIRGEQLLRYLRVIVEKSSLQSAVEGCAKEGGILRLRSRQKSFANDGYFRISQTLPIILRP